MNNIISAALEEVCMRGASGIRLLELWPSLLAVVSSSGLELSDSVKKVIWCHLTSHIGLRFLISGSSMGRKAVSQQPLEELEKIGLSVVAEEHLRDSFLGLYDLKHSPYFEISQIQRRVLERLAMARSSGITQNDLAKEFNMKGTNFFYVVRNLECQQLIVRQSIMVRDKESKNVKKGPKGDQIVNTNLLRLSRFAKDANLNTQQRIEITRSAWPKISDESRDAEPCTSPLEGPEYCVKEDVHINDYMPAMKAICEKLEAAQNKVDVVSSIKSALGYRKSTGHRAWRSILYRLKDSGLVEEFEAKVKGKDVACLRSLKTFDPIYFQPKTIHKCNTTNSKNLVKSGKRGQITDQLVEIPLEHLIYDMIDATGQKGITTLELSTRLGITLKKLHKRVFSMCEKFGVVSESEIHDKAQVYRFWTNSSHHHDPCKNPSNNTNLLLDGSGLSADSGALVPYDCPVESSSCYGPTSEVIERDKKFGGQSHKVNIINSDAKFEEASSTPESQVTSSPSNQCFTVSSMPLLQTKKYACKSLTVFAAQREQRILEKLKIEKFLLKVELHKWLEDIEKDKPVTMDRKTLDRSLRRLQAAGYCQCISVYMPSLTNFSGLRSAEAILHTSVKPSQELLRQIYERQRSFDVQSRKFSGSARLRPEHSVDVIPELKNVKAASQVDDMPMLKAMVANGFVLAKMVRAKLLHKFLWCYLSSSPSLENALISSQKHGYNALNSEDSDQLFSIDDAIKEMPLELFLQVAGSRLVIDNLERKCKQGLRLSELPVKERRCLLDMQTTSRLSSIVEILHRLKLIQLVNNGAVQDVNMLSYALELRPYVEEPLPTVLPTPDINNSEDFCKLRHDFILSDKQAVDKYWETLEYCFAAANSVYSRQCFPGSTVGEVFLRRSWASVRVMTIEQRTKLFKRVTNSDQTKKISFSECVKISRELNLSLEQVLRVSYDKRQARLTEYNYVQSENHGQSENTKYIGVVSRKRRLSTDAGEKTSSDIDVQALHLASSFPSEGGSVELFQSCNTSEQSVTLSLPQSHEEDAETAAFISQCTSDELKPTLKRRFYWTDSLDRQLIILYARERAMLGAKNFRVEWSSLLNLPAHPDTCKRRIYSLKQKPNIRWAISRLCGLLGERYSKYLDNSWIKANQDSLDANFEQSNKDIILYETVQNESASYLWDNFEDSDIKLALDEVFKYKRLARMEDAKRVGCKLHLGWTNNSSIDHLNCSSHESEQHNISSCVGYNGDKRCPESTVITSSADQNRSKSNNNSSRGNISKYRGRSKISQICESLPIASAIELLKLVFLSCSKSPRVQNSLARTLKKYHHGDIFAAFSYLREKNYLVIGHGTRPFVLSRKFFHNISSSPFPNDSGKRATNFSSWLQQQQNDLVHDGVSIAPDLQCGEIFHLFSLVLSGEISVSPSLPCAGLDEADEFPSSDSFSLLGEIGDIDASKSSKRKGVMPCSGGEVKKPKIQSKADCDRKDKGFPGIKILLKMESGLGDDTFECLEYGKIHGHVSEEDSTSVKNAYCLESSDNVVATHDFGHLSSWDAMTRYFDLLSSSSAIKNRASPSPTVFKFVHSIINQAGKHGLTMDEISYALQTKGKEVAEMFVDTLEVFRLAVKVNAFDSIRVVDASFTSNYFISVLGHEKVQNQGYDILSCTRPQVFSSGASEDDLSHQHDNMDSSHINPTVVHNSRNNANGLDMSNQTSDSCTEVRIFGESAILVEESKIEKSFYMQNNDVTNARYPLTDMPGVLRPILPWINGDGSTNMNVYRGLTRRILGIIMQNPSILEEDIIAKMDVLNPQSCKRVLETMLLDNHIRVRLVHQTSTVASPPSILQNLFVDLRTPALILRKHYFANPMSTRML
ncbi:hypothetical protein KSP40_PGU017725 [Platanthera guangdongensis]|uniref:B-block binding subunit of TFIIIC domain-containing protein n=1 Tax=Platanthera guangdongensis TaxID=2320717 RepID=A0ABR2LSR4_9ASPA